MLGYEEEIMAELLSESSGGLVVLSSGLRLQTLVTSLISLHSPPPPPTGTLLILTSSPPPLSHPLLAEIPGDLLSSHRESLYKTKRSFFVTPRILIADLLTGRCEPRDVSGIVVMDAHRVSDTSKEAFVVRLVKIKNKEVRVWGFSDRPQAMVSGFAKVERIMLCLGVRKIHLWPRFQVQVSTDLEKNPPEVVDIRVPMTLAMKGIQNAVLGTIDACLKELRGTNKVDVEDLTVENGLFKSFDEIVRRQLDPIWHTLGKKTRQLVADLTTLRKLADYLVRYDAVTYLKYLDTLRASAGTRSVWIFADSSYKIFEFAKRRVYQVVSSDGSKVTSNTKVVGSKKRKLKDNLKNTKHHEKDSLSSNDRCTGSLLEEVLEEPPKWKVLRELLEEIEEKRRKHSLLEEGAYDDDGGDNEIILVACKDEFTCMQMEDCITKGIKQVIQKEWKNYLLNKIDILSLSKQKKQKNQESKGFGVLNGEFSTRAGENIRACSMNVLENDVLLAAASKIEKEEKTSISSDPEPSIGKVSSLKVNNKCKKGSTNVLVSRTKCVNNSLGECKHGESSVGKKVDNEVESDSKEDKQDNVSIPFLQKHSANPKRTDLNHAKSLPPVQFYAIDSGKNILDMMKPSIIIVYHPDMTFVREIEIYKADNPSKKLRVYFLFYEDSTEVQKFEASIQRENRAFESLIKQKSLMVIPVDQDGQCTGFSDPESLILSRSSTRKAGGRKLKGEKMQVIVDMREFNSSLPNVIHQTGMRIIPVTLEVGDYVLSPAICVERKSIADLFQSFASGRLYHQVEMMSRYYPIPVLLIEFSQDKSFSFQSANEIGDDVSSSNIVSKLSLLVLHFPRLRLIWSRSVHATAEIFASLKINQDEPDEVKAIRVGVPSEDGIVEDDVRAENYNTGAIEFLRRLPGVTDANYRSLMDGCNSLAELADISVEKLAELMGGQKAARTLREFLDAKCVTMLR